MFGSVLAIANRSPRSDSAEGGDQQHAAHEAGQPRDDRAGRHDGRRPEDPLIGHGVPGARGRTASASLGVGSPRRPRRPPAPRGGRGSGGAGDSRSRRRAASAAPAMMIQISALTPAARIGSWSKEPMGVPSTVVTDRRTMWTPGWVVSASNRTGLREPGPSSRSPRPLSVELTVGGGLDADGDRLVEQVDEGRPDGSRVAGEGDGGGCLDLDLPEVRTQRIGDAGRGRGGHRGLAAVLLGERDQHLVAHLGLDRGLQGQHLLQHGGGVGGVGRGTEVGDVELGRPRRSRCRPGCCPAGRWRDARPHR